MGENRMSLKLIPLYDPEAIINSWFYLSKGLDEVLQYTNGDASVEKTFNDLMAGRLLAWVGWEDGEFVGMVTTRIDDIPTCYRALSIIHLYVKPGHLAENFLEGMKELENFARKNNCSRFRMWTLRDRGFARVLKPHGWDIGYYEFVKEVDDGVSQV